MLSFLIARDTMHQNQWLAAIAELETDGLDMTPAPITFPQERERSEGAYQFCNCSGGTESEQGGWAKGPTPDGKGQFEYLADPKPLGEIVAGLSQGDPLLHGTPKKPMPPTAS